MSDMTDSSSSGSRVAEDMPDVSDVDDVVDAIEMCEAHDVPYDGLEDVQEFIARLRLHFLKMKHPESRKVQTEKSMQLASKDDERRRQKLVSVIRDMRSIIHRQSEDLERTRDSILVQGLLKTEGTSEDLSEDCKTHIQALKKGECVFLVAGETSAGKSSVLNLLFGEEILPVHNNSSTSTITVIRYHPEKHVRIVYKQDIPDAVFELDKEGLEKLHAVAFMKSASEREHHNIQQVQVFLPLPLLQSGLVLVDTPGIGENEFLEKELTNFIHDHTIMGFMYIIKTDNAGGVQEDRLLGLLKIVLEMQRSMDPARKKLVQFDPKSALFVCNRVDLVDNKELEQVKQNAIDKLNECWPGFDKSQVVFFSTAKAHRDVNADEDYINDNYKELLDALKNMFISSLERRIKQTYRWIENVLKRIIHHLRTVVKRLDLSDMDLRFKSETARAKLSSLKQKSDVVFDNLKATLDEECSVIRRELKEFLDSEYCRNKLLRGWNSGDLPSVDGGLGEWDWIRVKLHEAFYDKLIACVMEWDKNERRIDKIEEELSCEIKAELMFLEDELKIVENEIQGDTNGHDDMESLTRSRSRKSLPNLVKGKYLIKLTEPKMPPKLAGRIIRELLTPMKNKFRVNEYKRNPLAVAEKLATKTYNEILQRSNVLMHLAEFLLQRPHMYIEAVDRRIPDMIRANEMLVNKLEKQANEERGHIKDYEEMMTSTESLKRSLMEYGEGYIFVDDFSRGELQIQQFSNEQGLGSVSVAFNVTDFIRGSRGDLSSCRRRDIRGLWTVVYGGSLNRSENQRPVAIKVYLPSSGVAFTYKEVAKLRCLTWQSTNIAEFLGIHNAEAGTPAFVFGGDLKSVKKSLCGFCNKREAVPEILEGTARGLEYLHNKGMVHMELTQDTVTLDETGTVRLTGSCLPRLAKLPFDKDNTEAGNFVYLAPEVLLGQTYESSADVYSFGLLILELAQADIPVAFKNQRSSTLSDFIGSVDPEEMLDLENAVEIFTVKTRALIINSLQTEKTDRPAMSEVTEYTGYIRAETDALARIPTRRSRGPIRATSRSSVKQAEEVSRI